MLGGDVPAPRSRRGRVLPERTRHRRQDCAARRRGLPPALLAGHSLDAHPPLGHGVVILDAPGSVTSMNDAAERWLAQIPECDWPSSALLPVPLLAAAA